MNQVQFVFNWLVEDVKESIGKFFGFIVLITATFFQIAVAMGMAWLVTLSPTFPLDYNMTFLSLLFILILGNNLQVNKLAVENEKLKKEIEGETDEQDKRDGNSSDKINRKTVRKG